MSAIKKEISVFDNDEFHELLEKRNEFIHGFFKQYISVNAKKEEKLTEFIYRLCSLCDKYTDILHGLISVAVNHLSNGKIDTTGLESYEDKLKLYIIEQLKNQEKI